MKTKRLQYVILLYVSTMLLSCGSETNIDTPQLTLNKTSLTLREGSEETLQITAKTNSENGNVIWASSSPEVATVDGGGRVKAIKAGETTILAVVDNASATCQVTVQHREPQTNVYVAGYQTIENVKVAMLWKNGEPIQLTDGTNIAEAHSVYVVGSDVYVAGYAAYGTSPVAVVWKNGVPFSVSYRNSYAKSVYVYNNEVYAAGREFIRSYVATLWKGTTSVHFAQGYSYAESVFVADGHTYVAGLSDTPIRGSIWKDGTSMPLTYPDGTTYAQIYSVYVSENDVYAAGDVSINGKMNVAVLWKNGSPVSLTDGTVPAGAESVFVNGSDVYVAGYDTYEWGRLLAMLWKNGEATPLTNGTSSACAWDVHVAGNQVYVAGSEQVDKEYPAAMLWIDGVGVRLTDGSTEAGAHSVFVVVE